MVVYVRKQIISYPFEVAIGGVRVRPRARGRQPMLNLLRCGRRFLRFSVNKRELQTKKRRVEDQPA